LIGIDDTIVQVGYTATGGWAEIGRFLSTLIEPSTTTISRVMRAGTTPLFVATLKDGTAAIDVGWPTTIATVCWLIFIGADYSTVT